MEQSSAMQIFEQRVSALMDRQGISKQELADRIGMDRSNLSKILRGVQGCTLDTLFAIAEGLSVDPGELVSKKHLRKISA